MNFCKTTLLLLVERPKVLCNNTTNLTFLRQRLIKYPRTSEERLCSNMEHKRLWNSWDDGQYRLEWSLELNEVQIFAWHGIFDKSAWLYAIKNTLYIYFYVTRTCYSYLVQIWAQIVLCCINHCSLFSFLPLHFRFLLFGTTRFIWCPLTASNLSSPLSNS